MESKEANVESASAYNGARSLHQTQRTEAEEEESESQRNQLDSEKERTTVKSADARETKKSKTKKRKRNKVESQDGSNSFTGSDLPSMSSKMHSKKEKKLEENDSTRTNTNQGITNKSFNDAGPVVDSASVNRTYAPNDEDKDCVGETSQNRKGPESLRDFVTKNKIMIKISLKEDELEKAHTKQEPLDSVELIDISGSDESDALTRYLRCAPDTEAEIIWEMMINKWKLKRPQLILSVTGGAQRFDLKRIMQEKFNLTNAATLTCTWIITGGTKSGVMELVGGTLKDHNSSSKRKNDVVVLGLAPWGCVANRQALEEERNSKDNTNVPLDEIHSHFILIDDGSKNKFGGEIDFRTSLEKFISEQRVNPNNKESFLTIPVISIIVDGGINSMKIMWQSVMNRIPVLVLQSSGILQSSGRAADFIALGYNITTNICNEEGSFFPITFDKDMKEFADRIFERKEKDLRRKQEVVDICIKQLREALQHREMLTVFDLNDNETEEFDRAILYALLKANRSNTNAQQSLALDWDRSDTVSKKTNYQKLKLDNDMMTALIQDRLEFVKLFQKNGIDLSQFLSNLGNLYINKLTLNDAMMTALKQDRLEIFELFLKNGIDLSQFLDISNLGNLYIMCFNDKDDVPARLLRKRINKLKLIERLKLALCRKCTEDNGGKPDLLNYIGKVIADLLGNKNINMYPVQWEGQRKNHVKHLFIWAVLMNRMSLARLFWRIGSDCIETALFASCVLKKLSKMAYDEYELKLSLTLTQQSSEFEKLASEILGICYLKNSDQSHQLLVRELSEFGNTTLFCLAEENRLMDFMAQTCCQAKLNAIWKGVIPLSTSRKIIVASILMPLIISAMVFVEKKANKFDDLDPLCHNDEERMPEHQDDAVREACCVKKACCCRKCAPSPDSKSKTQEGGCQHGCSKIAKKCFQYIFSFYTAPVTKFITAMLANIVFLGLFSSFVLTDLHPIGENGAPSLVEIFSWIYAINGVMDDINQVVTIDHNCIWYKIRSWFSSAWNRFDIVLYLFFFTSVILRFSLYGEDFVWARSLYSLTLGMYFFRFLQYFDAEKNIGPKVTMISKMLKDLKFFLLILLVFILSFGVTYQANLYPNAPQQWSVLKDVLYYPYWQMYGELSLENIEGKELSVEACTDNETLWRSGEMERCPEKSFLVELLMAVFMLLTNVLLLNLLIAMFSDTVMKVHGNSEKEWRFHRFSLVYEYYNRPFLFPPLNILVYMIRCCRWCCKCCFQCCRPIILFPPLNLLVNMFRWCRWYCCFQCCRPLIILFLPLNLLVFMFRGCYNKDTSFRKKLSEKKHKKLSLFEREAMEEYMHSELTLENDKIDKKIQTIVKRMDRVNEKVDEIKDKVYHLWWRNQKRNDRLNIKH